MLGCCLIYFHFRWGKLSTLTVLYDQVIHAKTDFAFCFRSRLGWILLFLSALEGATGMVPAIYTDLADDKSRCGLTHGIGYVSIHL